MIDKLVDWVYRRGPFVWNLCGTVGMFLAMLFCFVLGAKLVSIF